MGLPYNMQHNNRYDIGYITGLRDVKAIIASLARDSNGNIAESIKVISHSMGAAYAKGFLQAIVEYMLEHPEECNGLSLSEYDFAPYQPYYQSAVKGVDTFQYSHLNDKYAGYTPIKGAIQMETDDNKEKKHSIEDFYHYIMNLPEGNYKFINGKFIRY